MVKEFIRGFTLVISIFNYTITLEEKAGLE